MLYKEIPDKHVESAAKNTLGEGRDVNPNSYETIQVVLENLCDQACRRVNREWKRIGFDEVPYRKAN